MASGRYRQLRPPPLSFLSRSIDPDLRDFPRKTRGVAVFPDRPSMPKSPDPGQTGPAF